MSALNLIVFLGVFSAHAGVLHGSIELKLGQESGPHITECDHYGYFEVNVPHPCDDLVIQVKNVSGEPNLYVSRDPYKFPTYRTLAWSSYEWGGEEMTISSWNPNFKPGMYYIGVHSYCGSDVPTGNTRAEYTVLVKQVPHKHPTTIDLFNNTETGAVKNNSYQYHRFCIPSDCYKVEVRLTNCIDPKVCPTTYSWPELVVSPTEEKPSVKSMAWILAEVEHRSVVLHPDYPDIGPGHYYVAVYGWCTPDHICPDKSLCGPCSYAQNTLYNVSVVPTDLCTRDGATSMVASLLVVLLALFLCL